MPPKYAIWWGSVWHKSRLESRDFYRKYGIRTPKIWHMNPPFYATWTVFVGVGVVFNLLILVSKKVRQYTSNLYGSTPPPFVSLDLPGFWACKKGGNPTIHLPFVLQYASHLYGSTPPISTAVLLRKYWGLGSPESSLIKGAGCPKHLA